MFADSRSDESIDERDHVLRLGKPRVADQRSAKRDAVACGAAIVHDADGKPRIDERLRLGIEPLTLVPFGTPVYAHDRRPRSVPRRGDREPLDALTVKVLEPERLKRPA